MRPKVTEPRGVLNGASLTRAFCRGRRAVDPAQSTPKGHFVLRADSILPYNCGGRAADGSTNSRPLQGASVYFSLLRFFFTAPTAR